MKVFLSKKRVNFYLPELNIDFGSFEISGSNFRLFFGSCNTSFGTVRMRESYSLCI